MRVKADFIPSLAILRLSLFPHHFCLESVLRSFRVSYLLLSNQRDKSELREGCNSLHR